MSKVRTLSYALNHAIHENFCPGESKRSAKFTKETFGVRTVYEIHPKHIAAYLEHKAETCNEKTLLKLSSHLAKLELCCKCTYSSEKINWDVKEVIMPVSANNSGITKDKPMDKKSVSKTFSRALKDLGLEKYNGNLNHALRKDWAQRNYDMYRKLIRKVKLSDM